MFRAMTVLNSGCHLRFVLCSCVAFSWACATSATSEAQTNTPASQSWQAYSTPTPLPTVAPEMVRKAYMNCLLESDRTEDTTSLASKARRLEVETQRRFCDNRKRDCTSKKDGADCRTFVEEFAAE